jgi:hypothetical protein
MGIYTEYSKIEKKNKSYTGAGVIVVEDYRQNNHIIPTILVARNNASNTVSDFGGGYDKKHQKIEITASTELLEESCNLILVDSSILKNSKYFDIEGTRDTFYRVYVIKAQNIASKYYDHNNQIITSNPASKRQWKETNSIHHIPIANIDFDALLNRQKVKIKDIHGEVVELHMRLRKALKTGKDYIFNSANDTPLFTKNDLTYIQDSDIDKDNALLFLAGTYQFQAKY